VQEEKEKLFHSSVIFTSVRGYKPEANEPEEIVQIIEKNFSRILTKNVGQTVVGLSQSVQRFAKGFEESD